MEVLISLVLAALLFSVGLVGVFILVMIVPGNPTRIEAGTYIALRLLFAGMCAGGAIWMVVSVTVGLMEVVA